MIGNATTGNQWPLWIFDPSFTRDIGTDRWEGVELLEDLVDTTVALIAVVPGLPPAPAPHSTGSTASRSISGHAVVPVIWLLLLVLVFCETLF